MLEKMEKMQQYYQQLMHHAAALEEMAFEMRRQTELAMACIQPEPFREGMLNTSEEHFQTLCQLIEQTRHQAQTVKKWIDALIPLAPPPTFP